MSGQQFAFLTVMIQINLITVCVNTGLFGQARDNGPNGDSNHNPNRYAIVCAELF
jgi:hypothetical protein